MDNNYSNEVLKISVARACTAFGFNHIHQSALESLTDIVRHYIESIGAGAKDSAESSERVFAGIQDVIPILESTRPKSSSWKELSSFAFEDVKDPTGDNSKKWSQPFPIDIPSFPVLSGEDPNGSRYQSSATFKDSFVPSHLPPYPPAHTYKRGTSSSKKRGLDQSVVQNGGQRDGKNTRKKKIDAVKSAEQSLSMIEDSVDATINKAK